MHERPKEDKPKQRLQNHTMELCMQKESCMGQLKTLGTNWGIQFGNLFGYFKKSVLSRLLIKLIKAISN